MGQCSNVLNLDMDFSLEILRRWRTRPLRSSEVLPQQAFSRSLTRRCRLSAVTTSRIIATICMFPSCFQVDCAEAATSKHQMSSNISNQIVEIWAASGGHGLAWGKDRCVEGGLPQVQLSVPCRVSSAHRISWDFVLKDFVIFYIVSWLHRGDSRDSIFIYYSYYMISWDSGVPLDVTC